MCQKVRIDLKRKVIKQLDDITEKETIVASNPSSYIIHDILKGLDLKHRERLMSLHSCKRSTFLFDEF